MVKIAGKTSHLVLKCQLFTIKCDLFFFNTVGSPILSPIRGLEFFQLQQPASGNRRGGGVITRNAGFLFAVRLRLDRESNHRPSVP